MATVVITISDEEPGMELSVGMEFSPPIKTAADFAIFADENPITHVAAFLAWKAINEYAGTDPQITALSEPSIVI